MQIELEEQSVKEDIDSVYTICPQLYVQKVGSLHSHFSSILISTQVFQDSLFVVVVLFSRLQPCRQYCSEVTKVQEIREKDKVPGPKDKNFIHAQLNLA